MTAPPRYTANRFTDEDRGRITAALRRWLVLANWPVLTPLTEAKLCHAGYRAIGCCGYDLRQTELDEVDAMVVKLYAARP